MLTLLRGRDTWSPAMTAVYLGKEVAEALDTFDRYELVDALVDEGWTDVQIATLTGMTTYTTGRIREALERPPNDPEDRVIAAMTAIRQVRKERAEKRLATPRERGYQRRMAALAKAGA